MAHRIEIGLKEGVRDALGEKVKRRLHTDLGLIVESVKTLSVFNLDMDLSAEDLETVATGPFLDPVIQDYAHRSSPCP